MSNLFIYLNLYFNSLVTEVSLIDSDNPYSEVRHHTFKNSKRGNKAFWKIVQEFGAPKEKADSPSSECIKGTLRNIKL